MATKRIPKKINEALGISETEFTKRGIFNGFIDIDNKFFIDPHLLRSAKTDEFEESIKKFKTHFKSIILLLSKSKVGSNDIFFKKAVKLLEFKEQANLALGISAESREGSGIGKKLAYNLASTAFQIIKAGIDDPEIFDLIGLIENNMGPDRISDMTAKIIIEDIYAYNTRLCEELKIQNFKTLKLNKKEYKIPKTNDGKEICLVPEELLREIQVALDWSDITKIQLENEELRDSVNEIIGGSFKEFVSGQDKKELKKIFLENPEILKVFIDSYKKNLSNNYDFKKDPIGLIAWHEDALGLVSKYPFTTNTQIKKPEDVYNIVIEICNQFVKLIENNNANKLLYNEEKKPRHESYSQLLFFTVAISYCKANNLDINPEVNSGRGPVDFKFSVGFDAKVNVEIKLTSNRKLYDGYTTQLEIYNEQEETDYSVYLILEVSKTSNVIKRLTKYQNIAKTNKKRVPKIIVADALLKPSASKATTLL